MNEAPARSRDPRRITLIVVVVVFLVILIVKLSGVLEPRVADSEQVAVGASITAIHNDAVADYDAALAAGKPIYVLFHSLTCDPCVQVSAVADQVVPEYTDTVTFVNAITDDPAGQQLAAGFSFEYIPTSFFVLPDGTVSDSYTGVLSAEEMRARLDALVAK
jgi:thioredoxin-like negative regulator of GroEL